jgi:hypothetical protein
MSDVKRYEHCFVCDDLTGKAGRADDSLYINSVGPFCENCYDERLVQCAESVDADPAALSAAQARCERLEEALHRLETWTHEMGANLCPGGRADSFGEGVREMKAQVARMLAQVPRATLEEPKR